jgi:histidinol-phosphate aminotransferase
LIAIANPNNPTGTYLPASEIQRLIDHVPKNVLILLDGAYAEYVDRRDYHDGIACVDASTNVFVTHSFSKAYGLAGMRIGWGYGPAPVIEVLNRIRTPFNTNGPALAAATAAMGDQAHVKRTREHASRWQARLREEFGRLGLYAVPSVTNFYLLDFKSLPGKSAGAAKDFLEESGIIPRPGNDNRFLRITIGTDAENEAVLETLTRYLTS